MTDKKSSRAVRCLDKTIKTGIVFMMIAIASLTFYQVVIRYGFNRSSSWSEEAIRFIFIWCSFLTIAMGVREKLHIGINIIVSLFSERLQKIVEIVGYIAIMLFSGNLVYYGWGVVMSTRSQTSPALGIPMSWIYLSVPVMGAIILFYCIIEIMNTKNELRLLGKGR